MTLQVEDVPLETAVRLIGEAANLKAVRLGNVVLVTTKAHAIEAAPASPTWRRHRACRGSMGRARCPAASRCRASSRCAVVPNATPAVPGAKPAVEKLGDTDKLLTH